MFQNECPSPATPPFIHQLPGGLQSPAQARALVGDALVALPDEMVALAQLLTSELVTNAVLHVGTALDLQIEVADFGTRITVQDSSSVEPERRAPSIDEPGGRGLALVDGLSSAWGWKHVPTGKRVWFELRASTVTHSGSAPAEILLAGHAAPQRHA